MTLLALLICFFLSHVSAASSEDTWTTTEEFSSDSNEGILYVGKDEPSFSSSDDESTLLFLARIGGGETPFLTLSDSFEEKVVENNTINFDALIQDTKNLELCFVHDQYMASLKASNNKILAKVRPLVIMRNPAPYKMQDVILDQALHLLREVHSSIVLSHVIFTEDCMVVKLMVDIDTPLPSMLQYKELGIPVQETFEASSVQDGHKTSLRLKEFNVEEVTEQFYFGVDRSPTTKVDFVCCFTKALGLNLQMSSLVHFYTILRFPELVGEPLFYLASDKNGFVSGDFKSPTLTIHHPDFSFDDMAMFYESLMDGSLERMLARPIRAFYLDGWKNRKSTGLGFVTYLFLDQHVDLDAAQRMCHHFEGRLGYFSNVSEENSTIRSLTLSHERHFFLRLTHKPRNVRSPIIHVSDPIALGNASNFKACQQILKGFFKQKRELQAMTVDGIFPRVIVPHRLTVTIMTSQLESSFTLMLQRIFFDVEKKYINDDLLDAIDSLYFVVDSTEKATIGLGLKGNKHVSVLEGIRLAVNKMFEDAVLREDRIFFAPAAKPAAITSTQPSRKTFDFLSFKNPSASSQVSAFLRYEKDGLPHLLSTNAVESFGSRPVNCLNIPDHIREGHGELALWLLDNSFVRFAEPPVEGQHFTVMASQERSCLEAFSIVLKSAGQATGKSAIDGSYNFVRLLFPGNNENITVQLCKMTVAPKLLGWSEQAGNFCFEMEDYPLTLTRYARFSTFEEFDALAPWYSANMRVIDMHRLLAMEVKNMVNLNFHQHGNHALTLTLLKDLLRSVSDFKESLMTAGYGETTHIGYLNAKLSKDFDLANLVETIGGMAEGAICGLRLPDTVDAKTGSVKKCAHIDACYPLKINGVLLTKDSRVSWADARTTIARMSSANCKYHSEKHPTSSIKVTLSKNKIISRLELVKNTLVEDQCKMNMSPWTFALHSLVISPPISGGRRGHKASPWSCEIYFMKYVVDAIGFDIIRDSIWPLLEEPTVERVQKPQAQPAYDAIDLTRVFLNGAPLALHEVAKNLSNSMTLTLSGTTSTSFPAPLSQKIHRSIRNTSNIAALLRALLVQKLDGWVSAIVTAPEGEGLSLILHIQAPLSHPNYIHIVKSIAAIVHDAFKA